MTSEWRIIHEAPNYAVSPSGDVKRISTGAILRPAMFTGGYPGVTLCRDGKKVSRKVATIVAEAFHGPRPTPKHQVAHGDGNKLNSSASNLRWATALENAADKHLHGTVLHGDRHPSRTRPERVKRGSSHPMARLTWEEVCAIRSLPITQVAAAAKFGISQTNVSDIRRWKIWKEPA